ncbi:MAG: CDP-alcohol phosphatidyltransferase family protein [Candidatus Hydrogenedentes bacterium]|nr:CDP-alcohol phosphatidyltransferase family protein [Candidatus Hydrogenedentota bacterium]
MTIPNMITLFRLALLPFFLVAVVLYIPEREFLRYFAFSLCIIAIVTDLTDGYIARKFKMSSELGARLDPMADKLAVNLSLVFLASNTSFEYNVPLWFPPLVVFRDSVIVVGTYLISKKLSHVKVIPRPLGKLTSFCLSIYIGLVTLQIKNLIQILLFLCTILVLFSLLDYLIIGIKFALNYSRAPYGK